MTPEEAKQEARKELARREIARRADNKFVPEPWAVNPDAGINPATGNIEALLQGATFGLSDEIQAGIAALTTTEGQTGMGMAERYKTARDANRSDISQFREQEGALAYVPEVMGGALTGLSGLAKAGSLKGAAAIGATEGAIAGAGYTDAEKFASPDTAIGAGIGAGAGGVLGFGLPLVGRVAKKGVVAVGDKLADRFPNLSGRGAKIAAEEVATGSKPDIAARYTETATGGAPKYSRDTLAIRAIDEMEIPENMVNAMKELSPADRQDALKMLDIIEKGKTNSAFADKYRPGDILGETLKENIDHLVDVNAKHRLRLDHYVKTQLKGKPVAVDDALQSFASQLDELGVTLNQSKSGKITPDFDGALKLNTNDRKPIREAIRKISRVIESGRPTADVVHDLKRALDNEIPWDAASQMTTEGKGLLKSLRHDLNETLRETFDQYKEINKVLEDTTKTLKDMAKAAGTKYNPESAKAGAYLGQELRKLSTNYNSRIPLTDAIEQVETMARKYGLQSEKSVTRQATAVNMLEDLFGPSASRGFRAEIQKGTRDGIAESAKRGLKGDQSHFVDKAIDVVHGVTSNASEAGQFKVLKQLLSRQQ